jgi:hypothetical protein
MPKFISIITATSDYINVNQIVYVESSNWDDLVYIHLSNGDHIEYHGTLADLAEEIRNAMTLDELVGGER